MTLMPKEHTFNSTDYLLYFLILFLILVIMYLHMVVKNFFYKRGRGKTRM